MGIIRSGMERLSNTQRYVVVDGSYGEGGGQIVRTGLALSIITGQPVEFRNIRAKRPNPGLQPQHLTAVHAAATISQARVEGAILGSSTLRFEPGEVEGGEFLFNVEEISGVGSAGSVMLIAQTILVPLALRGQSARVILMGGTHVGWSPSADYIRYVYLPALRHFGIEAELEVEAAGFYPKGGGRCVLTVHPAKTPLRPIEWVERGALKKVWALFTMSNLPEEILPRGDQVVDTFVRLIGLTPAIVHQVLPSRGFGLAVTLAVEAERGYAGFIRLGRRGVAIEQVVEEAWNEFIAWARTRTAVDHFLADQLLLPALFADGSSAWTAPRLSNHLRTSLWLAGHFIKMGIELMPCNDCGALIRITPGGEGVVNLIDTATQTST
ncbi:MAG: RNA 3'-terminal phosphate cyclase [Armatimonadota bacterium]